MSNFPLYTTLNNNVPNKDLTITQKNELIRRVKKLNHETHELVYALIKCYFLDNEDDDSFVIPYKGVLAKDRIDFDLLKLPVKLRQILYKFVTIHNKKLKEDKEIEGIHKPT